MNNIFNNNDILPKKNNNKKDNLVSSLKEVEIFLNNLNCFFSSIEFIKLFKKFK